MLRNQADILTDRITDVSIFSVTGADFLRTKIVNSQIQYVERYMLLQIEISCHLTLTVEMTELYDFTSQKGINLCMD